MGIPRSARNDKPRIYGMVVVFRPDGACAVGCILTPLRGGSWRVLLHPKSARTISQSLRNGVFLAALGAKKPVHGVRGAAGGLVVVPHLHLAQQADGQHVQSS